MYGLQVILSVLFVVVFEKEAGTVLYLRVMVLTDRLMHIMQAWMDGIRAHIKSAAG